MSDVQKISCTCGKVGLEVSGTPIISSECCCNSCRAAGKNLEQLQGAPKIVNSYGATRFMLYRKDKIRFLSGHDLLAEYRLKPDASTRRVVATCCNTPVFLEFENGHWLSLYGNLWPETALPPIELITVTGDLQDKSRLPKDIPHGKLPTLSFYAKLLGAWIAMGFKTPKVDVPRKLQI